MSIVVYYFHLSVLQYLHPGLSTNHEYKKKKSVTLGGIKFDDKYADILLCSKCLQF